MRNFRDAKAMAHTLRASLSAMGFKISVSQGLELIAHAFDVADWNTLFAAIRAEPTSIPAQALEHAPKQLFCSFCGKSQDEVRSLCEGGCTRAQPMQQAPRSCVFICDECVELCAQVNADLSPSRSRTNAA